MFSTLGIIPARGGSKGVYKKNIRPLAGRPLIAYTIEAADKSRRLTRWLVSTEDEEIFSVASGEGAEVLRRPAEFATDHAASLDVVKHAVEAEERQGRFYDCIVLLQPTSPLRNRDDIDGAVSLLYEKGAESVISVYPADDYHPEFMYTMKDGFLEPYVSGVRSYRRQDLEPVYYRNGAVYAFRSGLLQKNSLIGESPLPYIMPRSRSANINDELDFACAEFFIKLNADGGANAENS